MQLLIESAPRISIRATTFFDVYIADRNVVAAHELQFHQYADDTPLYMSVLSNTEFTFDANYVCVSDVTRWFLENGMLLNPDKTKSAPFGTRVQRAMVNTAAGVEIAGVNVPFSDTVKLLGVKLDSELSLDKHVSDIIWSCNYNTRALRHIRPLLSDESTRQLRWWLVESFQPDLTIVLVCCM